MREELPCLVVVGTLPYGVKARDGTHYNMCKFVVVLHLYLHTRSFTLAKSLQSGLSVVVVEGVSIS